MAILAAMPALVLPQPQLQQFGARWEQNGHSLSRTPPLSSLQLGDLINVAVADALAVMLGGIPVRPPTSAVSLIPPEPDCVERGHIRIIGGVRPQNFDVGYRPDGVRFAFDSKTLNDLKSVGKNYQNMINDLATEATTVHTRFPYAIVAFIVAIPAPCLVNPQQAALIGRLSGLGRRDDVNDPAHLAESIALAVWDPRTGAIDPAIPPGVSNVRLESFSQKVQDIYFSRYQGMPPHIE